MMKKPHDPSGRFIDRPFSYNQQAMPVLRCALQGITKALVNNAKEKGEEFNQRVWYRLLMNLMLDTACNSQDMSWKILQGFADTYLALNPVRVPNFAYAWLDLISNKMFMPRILNFTGRRGWLLFFRIFMGLLNFIGPYLARIRMSDNIKNLYICTLRTLLVLLHDFPEFLSDYHMAFCDVIPWQCVQIRNLILAAFPSSMKLPDPFTQSLKVDMLPEVKVTPTINSTYLSRIMVCGLKADIDSFIRTRDKSILENIRKKLLADPKLAIETGTKYNIPLLNATILYAGANCNLFLQAKHLQTPQGGVPAQDQQIPSLELFWSLLENFDTEGRFLMFTTFANHLRFPNMHTHCFSCIVLWLFHDAKIPEVREQITRVLLERLIVHRPHPWGLLITFIELIKNRRYNFWNYPFVQSDPQLQKLFTSVAFTCLGQPVPKDDENLDLDGQLKYLQNYRFLDAAHQQLRQQQLDAASQQQQMAQQRVQAQAQAQVQQVQQAAALVQNVAHNPPQEAPPGPPQAAQPKPKAVPANAAANAGPPKGPPLTPPPVPPPAPQ
ncbi:unnamed protein product [Effrenium voratum]|nr:unnamed protein product [Effrenium voratum]